MKRRKRWPARVYVGVQDGDVVVAREDKPAGRGITPEIAAAVDYHQYVPEEKYAELATLLGRWLALGVNVKGIRPIALDRATRKALGRR